MGCPPWWGAGKVITFCPCCLPVVESNAQRRWLLRATTVNSACAVLETEPQQHLLQQTFHPLIEINILSSFVPLGLCTCYSNLKTPVQTQARWPLLAPKVLAQMTIWKNWKRKARWRWGWWWWWWPQLAINVPRDGWSLSSRASVVRWLWTQQSVQAAGTSFHPSHCAQNHSPPVCLRISLRTE